MNKPHLVPSVVALATAALMCTAGFAQAAASGNSAGATSPAQSAPESAVGNTQTGAPQMAPQGPAGAREQAEQPRASSTNSQFDRNSTQAFVDQAAYANRAEIAEARYVSSHTKSQAVKDFAKQMMDDHTASLHQLEQVATADGLVMPNGIDKKDRSSLNKLKKDHGARMDMAYSSDQETDHKEVIAKFQEAANNEQLSPGVRGYAKETLPTLKQHLKMAQQLVATESKGNHAAG